MSLSTNTIKEIQSIIQKFIDEKGEDKKEEHVQSLYTLKILKLLGWDSHNLVINDRQEIKTGKPDIQFKGSGGGTIFIIESKGPKISLDDKYQQKTFREQLYNYCNAEGIYWGVLTNFKEWRIYNSYTKRLYNEKIFTLIENKINSSPNLYDFFDKISYNFLNSRKGKIEPSSIYYRELEEIRSKFFDDLKLWRAKLRNFLFTNYKNKHSKEEIEQLTQKILDRLIFIKVCTDKGIITNEVLSSVLFAKDNKYEEIKKKFKYFDERFNSDLFAKSDCDDFKIENSLIESILRGINNTDFSNLSVQIIGEVYEDYLGELLRKTKEGVSSVEAKTIAKRKSQGIYYTPDYIVNYIVENTLGEKLRNCKTEKEIEKIRVLDPACGSGSFLIKAFDEFYKAYRNIKKDLTLFEDFKLKGKILLYNLYGVDIDERAVDIAKLNLLIKALEGTSESALMGKRKLLPNLSLNIRCGNSLISGGYKTNGFDISLDLFDDKSDFDNDLNNLIELKEKFRKAIEDEEKKQILGKISIYEEKINGDVNKDLKKYFKNLDEIKPFSYEVAFCEVFKEGRFDCLIGNPPYKMYSRVTGTSAKSYNSREADYLNDSYPNSAEYKLSTYAIFTNKALSLLSENGRFAFILPDSYILGYYFSKLRHYILKNFKIVSIIIIKEDFWKQASVGFPSIIVLGKDKSIKSLKCVEANTLVNFKNNEVNTLSFSQDYFKVLPRYKFRLFFNAFDKNIIEKIEKNKVNLDKIIKIQVGVRAKVKQKEIVAIKKRNATWHKGLIDGNEINRYIIKYKNNFIHINKKILWAGGFDESKILNEKLLIRKTGDKIISTYDNHGYYHLDNIHFAALIDKKYSLKYILGILNSTLFKFYYQTISMEKSRAMAQTDIDTLNNLKIPKINFKNKQENDVHDKLVILVDEMLKLNNSKIRNEIKISAKDSKIDDIVYKLYDLTRTEIKQIELKTK